MNSFASSMAPSLLSQSAAKLVRLFVLKVAALFLESLSTT
jgi:hypothetical protein